MRKLAAVGVLMAFALAIGLLLITSRGANSSATRADKDWNTPATHSLADKDWNTPVTHTLADKDWNTPVTHTLADKDWNIPSYVAVG